MNTEAQQLAAYIITDQNQTRSRLRCNPILSAVAADKAREMAEKRLVSHFGKGGPNRRLRSAGYVLPRDYPRSFANQVESVAGGVENPEKVWSAFKKSTGHRTHLLGQHPFYNQQDEIGVGFYYDEDSPHQYYWVVYIAAQDKGYDLYASQAVPSKSDNWPPHKQ